MCVCVCVCVCACVRACVCVCMCMHVNIGSSHRFLQVTGFYDNVSMVTELLLYGTRYGLNVNFIIGVELLDH